MNKPFAWLCIIFSFLLAACEPQDRRPGTWLTGELETNTVTDWSFSNEHQEVFLQTHPWYGIPHSVTVVMAAADSHIYVPSIYMEEPKTFPDGKYWNRIVSNNPNVEIKIGDKLYPRVISLVTEDADFERGLTAFAEKYPFWKQIKDNPDKAPTFVILRLDEPNGANL